MNKIQKQREEELNPENTTGSPQTDPLLRDEYESNENDSFINGSMFTNLCVFIGFALFALTVNYVIKTVNPEDGEVG